MAYMAGWLNQEGLDQGNEEQQQGRPRVGGHTSRTRAMLSNYIKQVLDNIVRILPSTTVSTKACTETVSCVVFLPVRQLGTGRQLLL